MWTVLPRTRTALATLALLAALAPVPAAAGPAAPLTAPQGAPDGDQQGSGAMTNVGPSVPSPEYLEVIDGLEEQNRDRRLIADSEGHLLTQGTVDTDDGGVDRLVAMNADDGSVAWTLDDIEPGCIPVATADGRIFAQLTANSDTSGVQNFSNDPVEIDAATGTITNRYTALDDDVEPRLNPCLNELRLGAGGVLIARTRTDDGTLVGIDSTTTPMSLAWRYSPPNSVNDSGLDRVVLSADGGTVYLGDRPEDSDPPATRVTAVDVASGALMESTIVPGSTFVPDGLISTDDALIVMTRAIGGQQDPPRLIALDPDTLAQRWVTEGGDDLPFDRQGRMTVSGDTVVVHASGTLIGFDLADGAQRWTTELTSFSNNGSQIVSDAAGRVYTSSFGGAPLQIHDATTGQVVHVSPDAETLLGDDVPGEATLGPILADGRLYALHRRATTAEPLLVAYGGGTARLDGTTGDPIDIAIQLCQYLFGPGQSRTIVLSRDDVFADTLAGAPLAGDHSCILFTPGGPDEPLDDRVLEEIQRALPPGGTVRVLGGVQAVSAQAQATLDGEGFVTERLAGPGRIDTAVVISDVVVAENPGADTAVVAFSNNWPDAVTAGAAAAARGWPVLLTGTDALPPQTAEALSRYGTTATVVPGGVAVISESVESALPSPTRLSGPNRHGTAAEVARSAWEGLATEGAFVLSNLEFDRGWALSLAASPLSVRLGAPQLGVRADSLPPETRDYLVDAGVSDPSLIVLGDLTVINDEVVDAVNVAT